MINEPNYTHVHTSQADRIKVTLPALRKFGFCQHLCGRWKHVSASFYFEDKHGLPTTVILHGVLKPFLGEFW